MSVTRTGSIQSGSSRCVVPPGIPIAEAPHALCFRSLPPSVLSFYGLPTASQENDDNSECDDDKARPYKEATMEQRRQVSPFFSGDITESNKCPRPHERAGIGEPSKHRGRKLRGASYERR